MRAAALAAILTLSAAGASRAEAIETWDTGFRLTSKAELSVPAARAYAAMGEVGMWWSNAHTYSRAASNMTMELKPGGCFCEALPGGGVQHGTVVMASPAMGVVRLNAPLGPLQAQGVVAVLTFTIKPAGATASTVEMTYVVSGGKPGLGPTFAAGVDGVMSEALRRYEKYVETGKPD